MDDTLSLDEKELVCFALVYVLFPVGFSTWVTVSVGQNSVNTTTPILLLVYSIATLVNAALLAFDWLHLCKLFYRGRKIVFRSTLPSVRFQYKVLFELTISVTACWITWNTLSSDCNASSVTCPCEKAITYMTLFTVGMSLLVLVVKFAYRKKSNVETPNDECCICLQPFEGQENGKLTCGHTFHRQCIMTWLLEHTSCPLCRATFTEYQRNENEARGLA